MELLERCKKGDKEAFGQLYTTYSKRMIRVIRHYIPDFDTAQDILHDGFLIVFSSINQLRNAEKLEYWMGAIMKNLALQYLKEHDIIYLRADDYDAPDIPEFEESITMEELDIMINQLPMGYRKVFKLAVLENKSHKEIAKLLGISEQTSGSQLFHARDLLRKMILNFKIKKGLTALAIIIAIGIFLWNNYNNKTGRHTIAHRTTQKRTERINYKKKKEEQTEGLIKLTELQNCESSAQLSGICVEEEKSPHLSTKMEIIISETETENVLNTNPVIHDIIPTPNNNESYAFTHDINNFTPIKTNKHNFNISIGGSVMGRFITSNSHLSPGDNPIWSGSNDKVIEKTENDLPITFGLNVSKKIYNCWSVESGLQYTLLRTKRIQTTIGYEESKIENQQNIAAHDLGVPLKLRFKFLSFDKFSLSTNIGGMVEFPLRGNVIERFENGKIQVHKYSLPIQWSVNGGIGIEYHLTPKIGIYTEPTINYYFETPSIYPTIRQENPLEISIPIGIRFTW